MSATLNGSGRLKVLVAEDEPDLADTTAEVLLLYGYDARVVRDGPSAVAACGEWQPDVVLLDINLPGMNGHRVAEAIREGERPRRPLLVAVTARGGPDEQALSDSAGIDLHLLKPVDPAILRGVIERFHRVIR